MELPGFNYFESLSPEMFPIIPGRGIMRVAEGVYDFGTFGFQRSHLFRVQLRICRAPGADQLAYTFFFSNFGRIQLEDLAVQEFTMLALPKSARVAHSLIPYPNLDNKNENAQCIKHY